MCRKLFLLTSFVLLLSLALESPANAQNQFRNWEFDEPFVTGGGSNPDTQWWLWQSENAALSVVQGAGLSGNNALKVDTSPGSLDPMQLISSYLKLEQGATYVISFMAKADTDRTVSIKLQGRTDNDWQVYWAQGGLQLTTEPQTYTFEYTHSGPTVGGTGNFNGDIDFYFTLSGTDVAAYFDRIWLGQENPPSPDKANKPKPADGALHEDTWASLSWTPGSGAASHDVYFGNNFKDVNDGAAETFQGNQTATFLVVGFPGFAFPDGLVPGTTYYWRVDEIEADGTTIHKGDLWSFTVPPKIAYNSNPPNGAKFVDPNVALSWDAGFGTKIHNVYFGDNFEDVNAGTPDTSRGPVGDTAYVPGTLDLDKTYYWRIDEFDGIGTYTGDVWSFETMKADGGVRADYYKGMNFENLVLTRVDPQINFNWGAGEPDPLVGADQFSVRWVGQVEAAFTETYTFYASTDDGVRLWVEGQQLVDSWVNRSATEDRGAIDLMAGQLYSVVMEYYEDGSGAVAELRWSSPRTPKQLIPQAALSLPVKASSANPPSGATDVKQTTILTWSAGDYASSHEVYFGTDQEAVRNADTSSPEYKGTRNLGSESYEPGKLEWDTTYYWRVDEINNNNPDSPWIGGLWSFTTANFLIVDDFEDYYVGNNEIWWAWIDGLGYASHPTLPAHPGNGTGSMVGDETTGSYMEETIVHGGGKSMPVFYDNNQQLKAKYSEAELTLTYPRDWTENGVDTLTIWFHGDPANAAETLYVALNGSAVVNHDNPNAAQIDTWTQWNIDLQGFADQGVNLANVNTIAIGFGDKKNPQPGGSGTAYFDDIRLYRPAE
jgi:hypothetical protein